MYCSVDLPCSEAPSARGAPEPSRAVPRGSFPDMRNSFKSLAFGKKKTIRGAWGIYPWQWVVDLSMAIAVDWGYGIAGIAPENIEIAQVTGRLWAEF